MLSPEGRCKTLDASADGYVRAEACGAALLVPLPPSPPPSSKPLNLRNASPYLLMAIIVGSAVNQDGRSSSLTAPNGPSQQRVIREALGAGGLFPNAISALQVGRSDWGRGTVRMSAVRRPASDGQN